MNYNSQTRLAIGLLALVLLAVLSVGMGVNTPPNVPGDTTLKKLPRIDTNGINQLDYQPQMHRESLKVWEPDAD